MISVLCPSRERTAMLAKSVTSLRDRSMPGDTEILVAADEDDPDTIKAAADLGARALVCSRHGYDGLHLYYGKLAAMATGDWLLVWNDDAFMMTDDWAAIIGSLPAGILVADLVSGQSPLCCFPAVRREAVKALGRFSTDNPHVDTFWQDLGYATRSIARVPVYVSHPVTRRDQSHDFFGAAHQAEMAAAAEKIRAAFPLETGNWR